MSKRVRFLQREKKMLRKRNIHRAEMLSEVGSLLVMMFVVAILLLYIDYSQIITTKIDLDNLNKNMLLTAEMYGGLSEEDMDAFYENLAKLGISKTDIVDADFPTLEDKGQIRYGEHIEVSYTVNISSPIYQRFYRSGLLEGIVSPTIPIHIYGATVSKW